MKMGDTIKILLSLLSFIVLVTIFEACNDEPAHIRQVDKVWSLAKGCPEDNCKIDDLATEFAQLTDKSDFNELADKNYDEYNFTFYLIKGRVYDKSASMLRKFFARIGEKATKKQLKEKLEGKTPFEILRGKRPSGEDLGARDQTLAIIIANSPEQINDLKSKKSVFEPEEFNRIMAKMDDDDFFTVVEKLKAPHMTEWISWAAANKDASQPIFKKIYEQANASEKTLMVKTLASASNLGANAVAQVEAVAADIDGADAWGLKANASENMKILLKTVVEDYYAARKSNGPADFAALYAKFAGPANKQKRALLRNELIATAYADGKKTDVKTAVQRVAEVIRASYLKSSTLRSNDFSPFDPNGYQATLLYAVLAQARSDNMAAGNGVLTYALVNDEGGGKGLVDALTGHFPSRTTWRSYIHDDNNLRPNINSVGKRTDDDLVGPDATIRVLAAVGGLDAVRNAANATTTAQNYLIPHGVSPSIRAILGTKLSAYLKNSIGHGNDAKSLRGVKRLWLKYY